MKLARRDARLLPPPRRFLAEHSLLSKCSRCLRSSGRPSCGFLPRLSQGTSTRSSTSSFAPSPVPSFRNRSTVHVAWSRLRAGSRRLICTRWLRKLLELLHGFIDLGLLIVGHVWIRWTLIRL